MSARGFLGAGDLYIARQVGGSFLEYEGPFECTKFEIKPNIDLKEQVSKGRSTYGQVIETVAIPKPAALTVDLAEVNKTSLALALLGTTANLAQAAGSLTAESVVVKLGSWVPLSKAALTGAQTVKDSAEAVTYVEGVDYLVNKQLGWIKAMGSTIVDGATLKVSSAYGAISGTSIAGQTQTQVRAKFARRQELRGRSAGHRDGSRGGHRRGLGVRLPRQRLQHGQPARPHEDADRLHRAVHRASARRLIAARPGGGSHTRRPLPSGTRPDGNRQQS